MELPAAMITRSRRARGIMAAPWCVFAFCLQTLAPGWAPGRELAERAGNSKGGNQREHGSGEKFRGELTSNLRRKVQVDPFTEPT